MVYKKLKNIHIINRNEYKTQTKSTAKKHVQSLHYEGV